MDASAPGSLLQQSEQVSRAFLDLLLPDSLVSYDGSTAGHAAVCSNVGGHHCRCAEAPEMTMVTPAHGGFVFAPLKAKEEPAFWI